jgi:hypothetical protein
VNAIGNEQEQILSHCFNRIYKAEFKEPVSQIEHHHKDADHSTVVNKFTRMDPSIRNELNRLAKAAAKKQSVMNLRLSKKEKQPVEIDENLF